MRTNLIMHMHCADCGAVLELAYDKDVEVEPAAYSAAQYGQGHDAEPTGAAVRYVSPIFVRPCRNCIEKHTGPAKRLAAAIADLSAA